MLKVYCYSRCTTCQKALKWLDSHGIKYTLTDIKTDHPDEKALREYYAMSGLPLKRFFNASGIPYRELWLSARLPSMSEDEQLALLKNRDSGSRRCPCFHSIHYQTVLRFSFCG